MDERGLINVRLHGPLGDRYGRDHWFFIGSTAEAIEALDANFPGFKADLLKFQRYAVHLDGDWFLDETAPKDLGQLPVSRSIDLYPVIEGRIVGLLVPVFTAIGLSVTAATIVSGVLVAGLLIGVSYLLSPKPKKKTAPDSPKSADSYIFSGPENVIEQGVAVPLIYGRPFVGSVVVSAGLEVAEMVPPSAGGLAARLEVEDLPLLTQSVPASGMRIWRTKNA